MEKEIDPEASAVLVIGFGLGYGAEAVRSRYPGLPLLVIEPDIGMFRAALSSRSFRALLSDPHVMLNVGGRPEGLPALLEKLPLAKPGFCGCARRGRRTLPATGPSKRSSTPGSFAKTSM